MTLFKPLFTILLGLCANLLAFGLVKDDAGKINATPLSRIVHVQAEADIKQALEAANREHIPLTIMGKQHSQGGQTLAAKAIALDMLAFNKILNLDINNKRVTVESGVTWSELQHYLNRYNLAIGAMQSPNIFTVGGSVSVNAHGDDFRIGSVANSIVSFHMLLANGKKVLVNPQVNVDLWHAVRGGYGLFGVITDVTLQLVDNHLLIGHYHKISLNQLSNYFIKNIDSDKNVVLFYGHVNIVPGKKFLKDMYIITYTDMHKLPKKPIPLINPDRWNFILTPLFNLSRSGANGKKFRWWLEKNIFNTIYDKKIFSRNNAMEKPLSFASGYKSKVSVDWLQEYFIPLDKITVFIDSLGKIIQNNPVNLLNVTIRYIPAEPDLYLSYARTPMFSVVLYFNQRLSQDAITQTTNWTRQLIDAALALNGNYYLTYQGFATEKQFKQAYPGYISMLRVKQKYDPYNLFSSNFFQTYFRN